MEERQIWYYAKPTTTIKAQAHCTPFTLPSNGIISFALSDAITLTSNAVFKPQCTGSNNILLTNSGAPSSITSLRDPFYASTLPQCYALAGATVIAYMLVIMLLITPRTFLLQGAVVLGRRGFTNGPSGSEGAIGIGGRPWLQKVAALTVAISLSIATSDTFRVAERQYDLGFMDAQALQQEVENGLKLKIIRVISDTFLWLAQAQTLIRLFPRQREKVIIKWTAFAFIFFDVLFSVLNNFVYDGSSRPRSFVDAIPALSYLFQLALSLLYCAWVIYYSLTKRRFAFYHSEMKNICIVAFLSLVAVLVPVVFFVLDISKPSLASWGDYVRWVGAAAASVVVWEWVERIEALERNEKKDGVLGREIFDGDEMLDVTPSSDPLWPHRQRRNDNSKGGGGTATNASGISWPAITSRHRPNITEDVEVEGGRPNRTARNKGKKAVRTIPPLWPTRPPAVATPVSRTDTASAESTVYTVWYHPISEATPPVREDSGRPGPSQSNDIEVTGTQSISEEDADEPGKTTSIEQMTEDLGSLQSEQRPTPWKALAKVNPFRKKVQGLPREVSAYTVRPLQMVNGHGSSHRWDIRARIEDFASIQAEKFRDRTRPSATGEPLPVTVIPAPIRRRNLAAALEELEELEEAERGQRPWSSSESTPWESLPSTGLSQARMLEETDSAGRTQPRSSDPYTPDDLSRHSITQRGTISFVTAGQGRREGDEDVTSQHEEPRRSSPTSSRSFHFQTRSSTSTHPAGLPVLTIPAPPRRPSPDEE
ncbi:hypothetical protein M430DRAFT_36297 [Amorphotheca resinae ATCC 22711]|jgi:hypothetical protein|uniref:PH-response regulator protein palH/RIM21 n=1 Tax=Amorphotheca resinae ATCC 22711 TaxID=857342 RepID=A0A2T3AWY5_AMORE|nr:hypothetical protein M430DRAFT_36297 [Amorphotheca resinae ATCC 22711]PSS13171.1 hypothetical protein M430DRAFT_36297 [Amorphotheca resinae ATCC 22711]